MKIFLSFIFLIIGIMASGINYFILLALIPLFLYLFLYKKKRAKMLLYLLFTLLGILLIILYQKGRNDLQELKGICVYRKENYCYILSLSGKYFVYDNDNKINLFSLVSLIGYSKDLSFKHYEMSFNFKEYLNNNGVFKEFVIKERNIIFDSHYSLLPLKNYASKFLNMESKSLCFSILFSDSFQDASLLQIEELNLSSIFSLSSVHLSFLINFLVRILKIKDNKKKDLLSLIILFIFLLLTGFRFSVRRLFLLRLISLINNYRKNKLLGIDRASLAGIILLLFEPFSFFTRAFYYPFSFLFLLNLIRNKNKGYKAKISFYALLIVFFFPFRLIEDNRFSLLSPFIQIILLPLTHVIFLLTIVDLIIPYTGYLLNYLVKFVLLIATKSNNFNLVLISGKPLIILIILYYLLLIVIIILKIYNFKKQKRNAEIILLAVACLNFLPDNFNHFEIHFIDVDQGDSTLIRYQKENILIDTGGSINLDLAKECLIPYFESLRIKKLDAVLITHLDYDHYGALESLKNNFKIENIYYAEDFLNSIEDSIKIKGLKIRNLNNYHISNETNDLSACYRFDIRNKKIMIMGDCPIEVEKKLIKDKKDIDVDILKVGHHGSKTSSSLEFLKKTSPDVSIISCGENNKYKFPNESVIKNLEKVNCTIRRTDKEGTIKLKL